MSNFYYDYAQYRCKLPKIPSHPHWVVMIITSRSCSDGYNGTASYQDVDYYHFDSEEGWTKMISDVYQENHLSRSDMVFFKSSGQGKLKISIDVKVDS